VFWRQCPFGDRLDASEQKPDNLPAHKRASVREIIEAAGAV
jgi:hypothetical protein